MPHRSKSTSMGYDRPADPGSRLIEALKQIGIDPDKTESPWAHGPRYGCRRGRVSFMVCTHRDGDSNRDYLWAEVGLGHIKEDSSRLLLWCFDRTRTMLMPFRFVVAKDPGSTERTLVLQCRLLFEVIENDYLSEILEALIGIGNDLKGELLGLDLGLADFRKH